MLECNLVLPANLLPTNDECVCARMPGQVATLAHRRGGGDGEGGGGYDMNPNAEAVEAAAALESEITKLMDKLGVDAPPGVATGHDTAEQHAPNHSPGTSTTPWTPRTPRTPFAPDRSGAQGMGEGEGARGQRGEGGAEGGGRDSGGLGMSLREEERIQKEAQSIVLEDLVRRVAEAEGGYRRVEAEV